MITICSQRFFVSVLGSPNFCDHLLWWGEGSRKLDPECNDVLKWKVNFGRKWDIILEFGMMEIV